MRDGLRERWYALLPLLLAAALFARSAGPVLAQPGDLKSESAQLDLSTMDVDALADALAVAVADDVRRDWNVQCDAPEFTIYDSDVAHSIQLTVSNKGKCAFTIKVQKSGVAATEDFEVPAGTPTTINRTNITKITVDCCDSADQCTASYTLTEGS